MTDIKSKEIPTVLLQEINAYLNDFEEAELLVVEKKVSQPYTDKTILITTYTAYINNGNLFVTMRYSDSTDVKYQDEIVKCDSMTTWNIQRFLDVKSDWFSKRE